MRVPHSWSGWIKFHFQSPDVSLTPLLYAAVLYELNAVLTKVMHPHPTIYPPSSLRSLFPHPAFLLQPFGSHHDIRRTLTDFWALLVFFSTVHC